MKKFFPAFVLLSVTAVLPAYRLKSILAEGPRSVLARSSNRSAFELMHAVLADDTANRLISPVSVYLSLGLLYNAAAKDTRDSIGHVLRMADMDIYKLNALSKGLVQQFSQQQIVLLSGVLNDPEITMPHAPTPFRPAGHRLLRGTRSRPTRQS
jgi:hypothetical protein